MPVCFQKKKQTTNNHNNKNKTEKTQYKQKQKQNKKTETKQNRLKAKKSRVQNTGKGVTGLLPNSLALNIYSHSKCPCVCTGKSSKGPELLSTKTVT